MNINSAFLLAVSMYLNCSDYCRFYYKWNDDAS